MQILSRCVKFRFTGAVEGYFKTRENVMNLISRFYVTLFINACVCVTIDDEWEPTSVSLPLQTTQGHVATQEGLRKRGGTRTHRKRIWKQNISHLNILIGGKSGVQLYMTSGEYDKNQIHLHLNFYIFVIIKFFVMFTLFQGSKTLARILQIFNLLLVPAMSRMQTLRSYSGFLDVAETDKGLSLNTFI